MMFLHESHRLGIQFLVLFRFDPCFVTGLVLYILDDLDDTWGSGLIDYLSDTILANDLGERVQQSGCPNVGQGCLSIKQT